MGEIIGAGLLAHVPTIVLPDDVRRGLNHGRESTLHSGLLDLRQQVWDQLDCDTVIVFDSHWFTTVEFVVTSAERRMGFYTSDELPRGMSSVPYDMKGDPQLAKLIGTVADETADCWITPIDNEHLPVAYATLNFLPFLQTNEAWMSISVCQTATVEDFLLVGRVVAEAVRRSDRKVVLIASGALSHTFHTLRDVRNTEAADEKFIFSSDAREADHQVIRALGSGDHRGVIENMPNFIKVKPEGRFGHYLMMASALGGVDCRASGVRFSDYENAIGTGQVHIWFDRPAKGWESTNEMEREWSR